MTMTQQQRIAELVEIALAAKRIYIPPHARVDATGDVVQVKGYWKKVYTSHDDVTSPASTIKAFQSSPKPTPDTATPSVPTSVKSAMKVGDKAYAHNAGSTYVSHSDGSWTKHPPDGTAPTTFDAGTIKADNLTEVAEDPYILPPLATYEDLHPKVKPAVLIDAKGKDVEVPEAEFPTPKSAASAWDIIDEAYEAVTGFTDANPHDDVDDFWDLPDDQKLSRWGDPTLIDTLDKAIEALNSAKGAEFYEVSGASKGDVALIARERGRLEGLREMAGWAQAVLDGDNTQSEIKALVQSIDDFKAKNTGPKLNKKWGKDFQATQVENNLAILRTAVVSKGWKDAVDAKLGFDYSDPTHTDQLASFLTSKLPSDEMGAVAGLDHDARMTLYDGMYSRPDFEAYYGGSPEDLIDTLIDTGSKKVAASAELAALKAQKPEPKFEFTLDTMPDAIPQVPGETYVYDPLTGDVMALHTDGYYSLWEDSQDGHYAFVDSFHETPTWLQDVADGTADGSSFTNKWSTISIPAADTPTTEVMEAPDGLNYQPVGAPSLKQDLPSFPVDPLDDLLDLEDKALPDDMAQAIANNDAKALTSAIKEAGGNYLGKMTWEDQVQWATLHASGNEISKFHLENTAALKGGNPYTHKNLSTHPGSYESVEGKNAFAAAGDLLVTEGLYSDLMGITPDQIESNQYDFATATYLAVGAALGWFDPDDGVTTDDLHAHFDNFPVEYLPQPVSTVPTPPPATPDVDPPPAGVSDAMWGAWQSIVTNGDFLTAGGYTTSDSPLQSMSPETLDEAFEEMMKLSFPSAWGIGGGYGDNDWTTFKKAAAASDTNIKKHMVATWAAYLGDQSWFNSKHNFLKGFDWEQFEDDGFVPEVFGKMVLADAPAIFAKSHGDAHLGAPEEATTDVPLYTPWIGSVAYSTKTINGFDVTLETAPTGQAWSKQSAYVPTSPGAKFHYVVDWDDKKAWMVWKDDGTSDPVDYVNLIADTDLDDEDLYFHQSTNDGEGWVDSIPDTSAPDPLPDGWNYPEGFTEGDILLLPWDGEAGTALPYAQSTALFFKGGDTSTATWIEKDGTPNESEFMLDAVDDVLDKANQGLFKDMVSWKPFGSDYTDGELAGTPTGEAPIVEAPETPNVQMINGQAITAKPGSKLYYDDGGPNEPVFVIEPGATEVIVWENSTPKVSTFTNVQSVVDFEAWQNHGVEVPGDTEPAIPTFTNAHGIQIPLKAGDTVYAKEHDDGTLDKAFSTAVIHADGTGTYFKADGLPQGPIGVVDVVNGPDWMVQSPDGPTPEAPPTTKTYTAYAGWSVDLEPGEALITTGTTSPYAYKVSPDKTQYTTLYNGEAQGPPIDLEPTAALLNAFDGSSNYYHLQMINEAPAATPTPTPTPSATPALTTYTNPATGVVVTGLNPGDVVYDKHNSDGTLSSEFGTLVVHPDGTGTMHFPEVTEGALKTVPLSTDKIQNMLGSGVTYGTEWKQVAVSAPTADAPATTAFTDKHGKVLSLLPGDKVYNNPDLDKAGTVVVHADNTTNFHYPSGSVIKGAPDDWEFYEASDTWQVVAEGGVSTPTTGPKVFYHPNGKFEVTLEPGQSFVLVKSGGNFANYGYLISADKTQYKFIGEVAKDPWEPLEATSALLKAANGQPTDHYELGDVNSGVAAPIGGPSKVSLPSSKGALVVDVPPGYGVIAAKFSNGNFAKGQPAYLMPSSPSDPMLAVNLSTGKSKVVTSEAANASITEFQNTGSNSTYESISLATYAVPGAVHGIADTNSSPAFIEAKKVALSALDAPDTGTLADVWNLVDDFDSPDADFSLFTSALLDIPGFSNMSLTPVGIYVSTYADNPQVSPALKHDHVNTKVAALTAIAASKGDTGQWAAILQVLNYKAELGVYSEHGIDPNADLGQAAATAKSLSIGQASPSAPWELTAKPGVKLGGMHSKKVWTNQHGQEVMTKGFPNDSNGSGRIDAEHIGNLIGGLHGGHPPETRVMEDPSGKVVYAQVLEASNGSMQGVSASSLTDDQIVDSLAEHVIDWVISNHDTHKENLLRHPDGYVYGIDKGQAWKFLGQDSEYLFKMKGGKVRSWLPPGNGAPVYYDQIYDAIASMDKDRADGIVAKVLSRAHKVSTTKEAEHRALLTEAFERRKSFPAGMTRLQFIDLAMDRKHAAYDDFHGLFESLYKSNGWDADFPQPNSGVVSGGPADTEVYTGFSSPQYLADVKIAGSIGVATTFAGSVFEDDHFVTWSEHGQGGSEALMGEARLDWGEPRALMDVFLTGVAGTITGGVTTNLPPDQKSLLGSDQAWEAIIAGAKTVNYHAGNGEYNQATLDKLNDIKTEIETTLAASNNPDFDHTFVTSVALGIPKIVKAYETDHEKAAWQAMMQKYLVDIETIQSAKNAGVKLTQKLQKADIYKIPQTGQTTPEPTGPLPGLEVKISSYYRPAGSLDVDTGQLIQTGSSTSPGANSNVYEISYKGIKFWYHSDSSGLARRGRIEFHQDGWDGSSTEAFDALGELMGAAGIELREATVEDLELNYWAEMVKEAEDRQTTPTMKTKISTYRTWQTANPTASHTAKVAAAQEVFKAKKSDTFEHVNFMPRMSKWTPDGKRQGHAYKIRPDAPKTFAEFKALFKDDTKMPAHSFTGGTMKDERVAGLMVDGGGMLSSESRLRQLGQWTSGMSSASDVGHGSSQHVFMHSGSSYGGAYFDPRIILRSSTYAYNSDKFGDWKSRGSSSKWSLTFIANAGHEIMARYGLSSYEDVMFYVLNPSQKSSIMKKLKARGITEINGTPLDEFFVLKGDIASARAKAWKRVEASYANWLKGVE